MKDDIKARMRAKGGQGEVKVELVGVPSFMQVNADEEEEPPVISPEKPWKKKKREVIHKDVVLEEPIVI